MLTPVLIIAGRFVRELLNAREHVEQRDAAAGNNALFHSRAGCGKCVLNAELELLHLDFGGCTNRDDGYAARELGQALLELFLVVIGRGFANLNLDRRDACFDLFRHCRCLRR